MGRMSQSSLIEAVILTEKIRMIKYKGKTLSLNPL
jgi:hypothetical protein